MHTLLRHRHHCTYNFKQRDLFVTDMSNRCIENRLPVNNLYTTDSLISCDSQLWKPKVLLSATHGPVGSDLRPGPV